MLLTQCAVCATELGLTSGKKCGRCSTRYCGPECQKQHWEEGGHDQLCKKIKKAGGAEQYSANKKYAEAVSVAAEACADDTKGQTCYICTQALHWKTKEGLVRMCACRGTAGYAHVSCLAEQAKILVADAEENNLGLKVFNQRFQRWYTCGLCEQEHHGVVACALGWACWKTYVGRAERDVSRIMAMTTLGNGLSDANRHEDALSVQEAELAMKRRVGASEESLLVVQTNLASTYRSLGRLEEALRLRRGIYSERVRLDGEESRNTLVEASNYAILLLTLERFQETEALLRKIIPVARRVLGENDSLTLNMRSTYPEVICRDPGATIDDLREAVTALEDMEPTVRRVLGGAHPLTVATELRLQLARAVRAREEAAQCDVSSVCGRVTAMMKGDA